MLWRTVLLNRWKTVWWHPRPEAELRNALRTHIQCCENMPRLVFEEARWRFTESSESGSRGRVGRHSKSWSMMQGHQHKDYWSGICEADSIAYGTAHYSCGKQLSCCCWDLKQDSRRIKKQGCSFLAGQKYSGETGLECVFLQRHFEGIRVFCNEIAFIHFPHSSQTVVMV